MPENTCNHQYRLSLCHMTGRALPMSLSSTRKVVEGILQARLRSRISIPGKTVEPGARFMSLWIDMDILKRIGKLLRKENPISLTTESLEEVNKQQEKGDTSDMYGFLKNL